MVVQKELDGTLRVTLNNGVVFWAADHVDLEEGLMEVALALQIRKYEDSFNK